MSRDKLSKLAAELEAEGFERGYRSAVKDMKREINNLLDHMLESRSKKELETELERVGTIYKKIHNDIVQPIAQHHRDIKSQNVTITGTGGATGHANVLHMIETKPGLRGAEIVEALKWAGTPVHERTVRTALWRLKQAQKIVKRAGQWYPNNEWEDEDNDAAPGGAA
ncbi:MAG TPA: hypothetical protein VG798_08005 [Rhizomicrobium sp.]|nr:hypothetical protein [Rhizomicrobium sp.]